MVQRLAKRVAKIWVDSNIINTDLYECYVYGIEIILLELFSFVLILLLGIFTHTILNAIIFLAVFITLRKYTGGYHASSSKRCNMCLVALYILILYVIYYNNKTVVVFVFCLLIIGLSLITVVGPVENENKVINENQRKKNKRYALIIYAFYGTISILLININIGLAMTISVSLHEIVVLMIIGKVKLAQV